MSLKKSEAILLKSFNWSESSRTVVLFSRRFGKLALVDKGGRSLKSKRGRLIPFARLEVTFYDSERESRGYIRDIDLIQTWSFEGEGSLGRLAYGSAACELCYLLLPEEEALESLYRYVVTFFQFIETAHRSSLPAVFLAFFLRLLSQLGYHPAISHCPVCGREHPPAGTRSEVTTGNKRTPLHPFSHERGGVVCTTCQSPGDYYIHLSLECFEHLVRLQTASLKEAALRSIRYREALEMLDVLTKFLSRQAGVKSDLKSLEFLEKLRNSTLTEQKENYDHE